MKAKLQRAKRTLDNMKKREAEALAAKTAAESEVEVMRERLDKVLHLSSLSKGSCIISLLHYRQQGTDDAQENLSMHQLPAVTTIWPFCKPLCQRLPRPSLLLKL